MRILLALALLACSGAYAATVNVIPPTEYEDGEPIPAGVAFQFKLYGAKCGQPQTLLSTFTSLQFTRNPTGIGFHCYRISAAILDSNGIPGPESEQGDELRIEVKPEEPEKPVARKTKPPTHAVFP